MRGRRKRAQREEVRYILHAMRLELAAHQLADDRILGKRPVLGIHELIQQARSAERA